MILYFVISSFNINVLSIFFLVFEVITAKLGVEPGPMIFPTRGHVWPKPQSVHNFDKFYMVVRTNTFKFQRLNETCDILEAAMRRYYRILVEERIAGLRGFIKPNSDTTRQQWFTDPNFRGYLNVLHIELNAACDKLPYHDMDEQYELRIDSPDMPGVGKLQSKSVWGILRGLETFVQLVVPSEHSTEMQIASCNITDFPRFKHRGLMVDTARHFQPLPVLMTIIDGMEASKLNVFHWHIVDEQAFPYQSKVFPELSEKGAYHPLTHVYTHDDIKTVIEYCRLRGIRVIPEFDSPGHSRSWGQSHPEVLTTCYARSNKPDGSYGPLDPTKENTFTFVKTLFNEVNELYPDKYFHLGGDEVDLGCWKSNAAVSKFMNEQNMSSNYRSLEQYYMAKVIKMVEDMGANAIVWQDVFDNGMVLNNKTIVHVWKRKDPDLLKVTSKGHLAILSECWYLNHDGSWKEFYQCEPQSFSRNETLRNLVIGGESCIWTEYEDAGTIIRQVFPRASFVAERLWSDQHQTQMLDDASRRMEEFRCKLIRRGVSARPVGGASFCPGEYGADWPGLSGAHKLTDGIDKRVYLNDKEYKLRVEYTEIMNAM